MRAVAKTLRAQASEHSSYFCEQLEQRPNFTSTFKLNGTIRYPYINWRDEFGMANQACSVTKDINLPSGLAKRLLKYVK